jgi:hypothetical protein
MAGDADDLIPLAPLSSASETDVVLALLQSEGIGAVLRGRYNPKGPLEISIPRKQLEEARRLVERARGSSSEEPSEPSQESRSISTAITWVLGCGLAVYALLVAGRMVLSLLQRWFR